MAEELVLGRCRYRDAITGKIRVMKWHVTEEDIHARLGDRVIARVEGSRQSGGPIRKGIVRGSWGAGDADGGCTANGQITALELG